MASSESPTRSGKEDEEGSSFNMNEVRTCLSSFTDSGSIESHRYFLARRTAMEMIRDRGYAVPSSELDLTLEEFRAKYGQEPNVERLELVASKTSDSAKKLRLKFVGSAKINVDWVRQLAIPYSTARIDMILVVEGKVTSQARKAMELLKFKVEVFLIGDLLVNITKHVLMPVHQVLTSEEKEKLLKKFSVGEKQLPRLLEEDAFVRYYGLEKGQIVKFSYSSGVADGHFTYRCVR